MSESSGNYRKLGRNGSGHHGLRSFSNFLLLLSAFFIFSLLYLYFSTSTELQSFRSDYDDLNTKHLKLKNELLDANLKLEQTKKDGEESNIKQETCQKELTDKNNKLNELQAHKTDCDGTVSGLNDKLELAKKRLEEKNSINQKSEATVVNLTKTIEQLQKELELARQAVAAMKTSTLLPSTIQSSNLITANPTVAPLEMPKATTVKIGGNQQKADSAHEQIDPLEKDGVMDAAHEKQSGAAADFIAPKRSPGGRVQLEEEAAKRDKLSNHKELLKAAAKMDKQQEEKTIAENEELEDGNVMMVAKEEGKKKQPEDTAAGKAKAETTPTIGGTTEKNRPLVDALHGIVA